MRIGVSCTELSGEHHAALLIDNLGDKLADRGEEMVVFGLGSSRLKDRGAELYEDIAEWGAMGAVTNLLNIGKMLVTRKKTPQALVTDFATFLIERNPDVVILVDSRVVNLSLAKTLREKGYSGKIVYHVAPVKWESSFDSHFFDAPSNLKRFEDYKGLIDYFFLIYPISVDAYERLGLPYKFIGHPMSIIAKPTLSREKFARLERCEPAPPIESHWISIFPGSRWEEVKTITPTLFSAAKSLADRYPDVQFIVPIAHEVFDKQIREIAENAGIGNRVSFSKAESAPDVICHSRVVIGKSGTVLHIAALAKVPMVMVYDVAPIQKWFLEKVLDFKFPYYSFPNIVAGREIIPELIKDKFSPSAISVEVSHLIYAGDARNKMLADLDEISVLITKPDPLGTASTKILELVS